MIYAGDTQFTSATAKVCGPVMCTCPESFSLVPFLSAGDGYSLKAALKCHFREEACLNQPSPQYRYGPSSHNIDMCMCMYVQGVCPCACVSMCACLCTHVYAFESVTQICVCMHAHVYMCVHVCQFIDVCVHLCACM